MKKTVLRKTIDQMEKVQRLNLINSISGYKSANLIGTQSENSSNLAVFSSVVHLGSNPPLLGMICRPATVPRHTLQNIESNGYYTINHITESMHQRAHYTSAKFEEEVSEFEACDFQEEYKTDFLAPFVKESPVQIGMEWVENIPIKVNGTLLIVGEVAQLYFEEGMQEENGELDLNYGKVVGISGLNAYHQVNKIAHYPYARPTEVPNFEDSDS
ncbi:MAG: flavin reductase [Vicingaceae bacterium]